MQLISVSLHDLQSRMAASPTDWIQYPDESFTQDNATQYYAMRRRSSQTGSERRAVVTDTFYRCGREVVVIRPFSSSSPPPRRISATCVSFCSSQVLRNSPDGKNGAFG